MSDLIVEVADLGFRYLHRDDWVLSGITLAVGRGEFLGITGPSGAGKSTFCLSMNGLIPHVVEGSMRGSVVVDGVDTRQAGISHMAALVGIVFQDPRAQLTGSAMTVEEEVAFGLQNLGIPRESMHGKISEALAVVGLAGMEGRSPFELSGGEQQRLSLATVLAMQPKVLVLDEPTEMLDPEGSFSVMRAIHSIHERYDVTTILVTNQAEILVKHSDRILVFNKGTIASETTPREFAKKVSFLEEIGVRPTQVSKAISLLEERGLWHWDYPLDESEAAAVIEKYLASR